MTSQKVRVISKQNSHHQRYLFILHDDKRFPQLTFSLPIIDRIKSWVTQLHDEGFLMSTGASTATPEVTSEPSTTASTDVSAMDAELAALAEENARLREMLDKSSRLLEETIVESTGKDKSGFVPHLNPKTGRTIWTSPDGKSCYFTSSSLFP